MDGELLAIIAIALVGWGVVATGIGIVFVRVLRMADDGFGQDQ